MVSTPSGPPYKNSQGQWYTQALFYEVSRTIPSSLAVIKPIFSLYKEYPHLVCARKTFVELGDPTGYQWAMKYLGDYEHWTLLCKSKWFQEALEVWLSELAMKQRSEAIQALQEVMKAEETPHSARIAAAKYVAEQGWNKATKGRPSKAAVDKEVRKLAEQAEQTDEDMQRIGLTVIQGGKE